MATKREIVEKVNAAFSENSVEGFLSCCTDDVEWTMVGDNMVKGKEAIRNWMGGGPPEPPQFSVDAIVTEGDYAAAYGDMTMKEDGKIVPYSYCDVYRFQGEKVATLKSYVIKTQKK
jgi:uncharacterized protein